MKPSASGAMASHRGKNHRRHPRFHAPCSRFRRTVSVRTRNLLKSKSTDEANRGRGRDQVTGGRSEHSGLEFSSISISISKGQTPLNPIPTNKLRTFLFETDNSPESFLILMQSTISPAILVSTGCSPIGVQLRPHNILHKIPTHGK